MTTYFNKTSTTAIDKRKLNLWLDVGLAILFILTILSLILGEHEHSDNAQGVIHSIAGSSMFVGCTFHLILHKRWIKAIILDTPKNLSPATRRDRKLFLGLLVSLIVCGVSGLASLFFEDAHLWHGFHGLSGIIFLVLSIYHLFLHRSWIKKKIGEFFVATRG